MIIESFLQNVRQHNLIVRVSTPMAEMSIGLDLDWIGSGLQQMLLSLDWIRTVNHFKI